jgi:DNA-binding NarL/FixJ family response regulator
MKKQLIKIILADDHQVVRDGIRAMIGTDQNLQIVGQAATGNEVLEVLAKIKADVLILDIELPDISGLEVCRQVNEKYPGLKILILSMYTGEEFIFKALSEGAKGYLPKNTTRDELIEAIQSLVNGKEYYSPLISEIMLRSYIKKAKTKHSVERELSELSKREVQVLKMLAEGLTHQSIAEKLFISIRTVESHKSHIMQKLELSTTAELVKFAIKKKLIEI